MTSSSRDRKGLRPTPPFVPVSSLDEEPDVYLRWGGTRPAKRVPKAKKRRPPSTHACTAPATVECAPAVWSPAAASGPRSGYKWSAAESNWDTPSCGHSQVMRRSPNRWMLYTALSAGLSAIACSIAFHVMTGEASAEQAPPPPKVVSYDASLLEDEPPAFENDDELTDASPRERERHLAARRIALRGRKHAKAGRTGEAMRLFKNALEYNQDNRMALAGLGEIYLARGDANRAVTYLHRGVRVEPRDAAVQLRLGDAYAKLGRMAKARRHYRLAEHHGHPAAAKRLANAAD